MESDTTKENVTVQLVISFDELVKAISGLDLKDKERLWEILNEQIEQADEDLLEQDPEIRAEIEQAERDIEAGNYITIEEYMAQRQQKTD